MFSRLFLFFLLVCAASASPSDAATHVDFHAEKHWLGGKAGSATLKIVDDAAQPVASVDARLVPQGRWERRVDGEWQAFSSLDLHFDEQGEAQLAGLRVVEGGGRFAVELDNGETLHASARPVWAGWALLPPLMSIVLALWLRQVLLALAAGIFAGAWILAGDPLHAFTMALQDIVIGSTTDSFQGAILVFTAILGGMVGVMARAGGTHGLVDLARRWIHNARDAQLATAALGLVIFFDDYANTLLVGNTMRPVTDRLRVSREKLSYLVDSTAAPVATVAALSTWVGYQVGLIGDGLATVGRGGESAYGTFVASIPYASYSWFALALVFWLILQRRDFGPMLAAERRARHDGAVLGKNARPLADDVGADLTPVEGAPRRAHVALIPVLVVLGATVVGLWWDGQRSLIAEIGRSGLAEVSARDVFSAADPAAALLWAVVLGSIAVITLAVGERLVPLSTAMDAWISGMKAMVPALVILILAWSIGTVCERVGTADVVVDAATGNLSARLVPTVTFIVAAFLGFSTGTSWGTMAILMPIVIPLADQLPRVAQMGEAASASIFLSSIACVLSGSVFGDHCSPISDTTIMSSMASGSDHVDHVRTQLPYALVAGACAVLIGTLPAGWGVPVWITLPIGAVLLGVLVRLMGRRSE